MLCEDSNIDLNLTCLKIKSSFSSSTNDASKWNLLKEFHRTITNEKDLSDFSSVYCDVTEILIESLRPTLFIEDWQEELFDRIFLQGINHYAFMALVRKFEETRESYQQKKIIDILQKFLKWSSMENLFYDQCSCSGVCDPKYISLSHSWNNLITLMLSLPERVANKTKGKMPKIFQVKFYVPLLTSIILKVLPILHARIVNFQNCTLEFLGILIGRLSVTGNGDILAKKFCTEFVKHSEMDFVYRKMYQSLISKIPINCLETFATHLLLVLPWFGYVDWILGEETMKNEKLKFIMTVKLILFRNFKQGIILQNIIGHYASSESRREHFWMIFESLLKIWADASSLTHQSYDQQMYISVALMICCGWLEIIKNTSKLQACTANVLKGVEIRIGNSLKSTSNFGMIVGATLLSVIVPEADKLDYKELVEEDIKEYLCSFTKIEQNPGKNSMLFEEELKCFADVELQKSKWENQHSQIKKESEVPTLKQSIETDDDLDPFDMSDDGLEKTKHPLYLNDCLQGLIEQENHEWHEQCLKHAETLITKNSDIVHDIAEEMTKVMLHLEDKYAIENFDIIRKQILCALAIHSPVNVGSYLTSQFYEQDYNIRQRLDILEIISTSSIQLSQPNKKATKEAQVLNPKKTVASNQEWKLIIEERAAAKTRHITKHRPKEELPEPLQNKFAPVAGYFFYPLMEKYDKENRTLKLFKEDSYVLGRLICTLGTVMYAACNTPLSLQMGEALMEFLLNVRNHQDVCVREAAIFALVTIYTSVPGYLLFSADSQIISAVFESQIWLKSVMDEDSDTNCQMKAAYAHGLILNLMKEENPLFSGILKN